jgi:hypothetical protein
MCLSSPCSDICDTFFIQETIFMRRAAEKALQAQKFAATTPDCHDFQANRNFLF